MKAHLKPEHMGIRLKYNAYSMISMCIIHAEKISYSLPIRPQKRVNVLGMRVCGLISIKAFFSVWM